MSSSAAHPDEILTERSASILLIQFNRPTRKNALTSSMYDTVANLPGALQATKQLLKRWSREQSQAAVRVEIEEFGTRVRSAEAREAITAFLEKRRPDFTHAK